MIAQLLRFGGIGLLATLVHVGVALVVRGGLGADPLLANLAGFCAALALSYVGHARWTFRVGVEPGGQTLRFFVVALVGLAISSGTVAVADRWLGLDFGLAMAAVAVLVPAATYLALRFWVFATGTRGRAPDWPVIGLAAGLALGTVALFWGRMINHDTAWYLIATRDWLTGAALYVDLVEVNPPLNFYLTVPALGLAQVFGVSDTNGQYLLLGLLIFLILCWCNAILRDVQGLSDGRRALFVTGIAVALVAPALRNFGQREQVMLILILPWVLGQAALAPATTGQQVARALVAALGICLKPHFVVFPMAATILDMIRQRSLAPVVSAGNLTFLAVGLAYLGFVAVVHPAYFQTIVPIARDIYGAYGAPLAQVIAPLRVELLLAVLPLAVVLSARPLSPAVPLFAVLALAGLGSYLLQATGFGYHRIPLHAFALLALWAAVLADGRSRVTLGAAGFGILGLLGGAADHGFYRGDVAQDIARFANELGPVESLIVLSPHVYAGPPAALALGATWGSRYPAAWLVPGALNRLATTDCATDPGLCARLSDIADRNRRDILADIARSRPQLLVFDLTPGYFDQPGFDWARFLAEDPAWGPLFAAYAPAGQSDRMAFFRRIAAP